jgi:hypothetical protein
MENRRLIPVTKWNQFHLWPTEAALRFYIFNAEFNGSENVVKRVGRRILIDEEAFFVWVEKRNQGEKYV